MKEIARYQIPAEKVSSLHWDGDELVDYVRGGRRYALNGSSTGPFYRNYGGEIEQASVSDDGRWVALYGNKAGFLEILQRGQPFRRVEGLGMGRGRNWVIFVKLNNRLVLVHAGARRRIQLEDVESGEMLYSGLQSVIGKGIYRLQALEHGNTLLCSIYSYAGGGDVFSLSSLERIFLPDQTRLEDPKLVWIGQSDSEVPIACKLDEDRIVFYSSGLGADDVGEDIIEVERDTLMLWNRGIGVYSLEQNKVVFYRTTRHEPFDLVPLSERYLT